MYDTNTGKKIKKETLIDVLIWTCRYNQVNFDLDLKYRIYDPRRLTKTVLAWYHKLLNHPGSSIIYSVISQYLTWSSMKTYVEILVKTFHKFKKFNKKPTGLMEIFHSMNLKYFHGSPIMLT